MLLLTKHHVMWQIFHKHRFLLCEVVNIPEQTITQKSFKILIGFKCLRFFFQVRCKIFSYGIDNEVFIVTQKWNFTPKKIEKCSDFSLEIHVNYRLFITDNKILIEKHNP